MSDSAALPFDSNELAVALARQLELAPSIDRLGCLLRPLATELSELRPVVQSAIALCQRIENTEVQGVISPANRKIREFAEAVRMSLADTFGVCETAGLVLTLQARAMRLDQISGAIDALGRVHASIEQFREDCRLRGIDQRDWSSLSENEKYWVNNRLFPRKSQD